MKIDALLGAGLHDAGTAAVRAERVGCDGVIVPEVAHDPFLPLALAAAETTRVRLTTGIAVAFARNPMRIAVTSSDLHRFSDGRFVLGLGSQIKAHVTRRFSMPWSDPAKRMAEYIAAVRAIWDAWETQTPLDFRGDYYQHTLMTPMFDHGPSPCGWPAIHLAAVGPAMTRVAGSVADGLLCHGFTTEAYLREVTIPMLERGLAAANRPRDAVEVSLPAMCAIADEDDAASIAAARSTISFYGSTPAYRPVLEHHGWGALGEELTVLSKQGRWETMGTIIDDDVLDTFYAVGSVDDVAAKLTTRFGDVVDRLQVVVSARDDAGDGLVAAVRTAA